MPPQTPSRSCHVAATAQLSPPNKVGTLELWVRGDFPLKMPSARCHQHANVSSLLGAWQRRPPSINMGHRGKGLDAFSLVLAPQCWSTFAGYPHSLALGRTPRMMGDYGPDSSTSLAALPVSVRCGVPLVASRSRLFCPDGRGVARLPCGRERSGLFPRFPAPLSFSWRLALSQPPSSACLPQIQLI